MKLMFLGDLVYDYEEINEDIIKIGTYLEENDIFTIINLEAPLKSNAPLSKWINLYNTKKIIDVLKILRVKAVNLANNHIMDWGEEGLLQLLELLEENEITYFGAGSNLKEAAKVKIINIKNVSYALMGFGWDWEMCVEATNEKPGVAPLNEELIVDSIKNIRDKVDYVVVNVHWGYECETYPVPIQRELAYRLIENQADLIIGHHAHVIQAYEEYKGKSIYYGLGNFYFGSRRERFKTKCSNFNTDATLGLGVIFDLNLIKLSHAFFKSLSSDTQFVDKINLKNISDIKMKDYNKYFKENRTSVYKPSLMIGENKRNRMKVVNFDAKIRLKKKIKTIIKK